MPSHADEPLRSGNASAASAGETRRPDNEPVARTGEPTRPGDERVARTDEPTRPGSEPVAPAKEPLVDEQEATLTHVDAEGVPRMVDVGSKDASDRAASATCRVLLSPGTVRLLAERALPKGDALTVARIAGIQAAKRTSELIPLCHQIALTSVDVAISVDVEGGAVEVVGTARTTDRTGVEMEALVATSVAALTVYDMVKAVQRDAVVTDLRLLSKSGGRRGDYEAE